MTKSSLVKDSTQTTRRMSSSEKVFRARWYKWETRGKSKEELQLLQQCLMVWAMDIVENRTLGQQFGYEPQRVPVIMGFILGKTISENRSLDEFTTDLFEYLSQHKIHPGF